MPAAWGNITVEEILAPTRGILLSGNLRQVFSGLNTDSRRTASGDLFIALIGDRFDGHNFALDAINRGATGIVIRKDRAQGLSRVKGAAVIAVKDTLRALGDLAAWWRRRHRVRLVAVTGSAGKTTTKEMISRILEIGGRTLASEGNFNNLIGLPLTLLRLETGHESAVLEMGMNRPGEIARLTEIADPDVGVITNVGMAHLEGLKDIKGVVRAKTEMVERVSPESRILLNGDDKLLMEAASRFGRAVTTFGFEENNDIRCTNIRDTGLAGVSCSVTYRGKSIDIRLRVPGHQNVSNALAATAAALLLDTSPDHIVKGLEAFRGVPGRFTPIALPGGITLVDDTYNANPSSLKAALKAVAALRNSGGRILIALGEMMELGDAAVPAHLEAGRMVAETAAAYLVAMGEHAPEMIKGALESGMGPNGAETAGTHEEMVDRLISRIKPGDLILVKGSRMMDLGRVVDDIRARVP